MKRKGLALRALSPAELPAANAVYAELGFLPSEPGRDRTFGAFDEDALVALGRASRHADGALEVGGFWTRPDLRRRGIARALVARVLADVPTGERAWCLPFDHLVDFYLAFGMQRAPCDAAVPASIASRQGHCKQCTGTYRDATLLVYEEQLEGPA